MKMFEESEVGLKLHKVEKTWFTLFFKDEIVSVATS